jgi:uncharacterized protein (TIGR03663 family)
MDYTDGFAGSVGHRWTLAGRLIVFMIPVLLGSALRFPLLAPRPMHCDEAVHADKFGILLEQGKYEYSKVDFHGPTLYYLTLLPAKLQGAARYNEISEVTLRILPAAAGVLLVAMHFFLIPYIGFPAAFFAALLSAVSPAMVYYSRFYIHETLFVLLTLGALLAAFRYLRGGGALWALIAGLFLGLMYATKETAIIALACMLPAAALAYRQNGVGASQRFPVRWRDIVLASISALIVSALLFSSFLTHPGGVADSVLACRTYFERGTGQGTLHVHPWHYYLNLLLFFHSDGGPVWTEFLILALAAVGLMSVFRKGSFGGMDRRILRFLGVYTVMMVLAYSLIPYKAPWNLLGFLNGIILLAGIGAVRVLALGRTPWMRAGVTIIIAAGTVHLGWQAWAASFRYRADPRNPWVYAHTGEDIYDISRRLQALARAHPARMAMPVQVISNENLWPLPWYLRGFTEVRWSKSVIASVPNAPVIIATPDMEPALIHKLYDLPPPGSRELYMNMFDRYVELRPQVELRGYVVKWLWDEYRRLEGSSELLKYRYP